MRKSPESSRWIVWILPFILSGSVAAVAAGPESLRAQSLEELEVRVVEDPQDAGLRASLARVLHEEGQLDRAVREYQEAIRLAPGSEDLYLGLAAVFETAHLDDEAITLLARTVEAFPTSVAARVRLAEARFGAGALDAALATFTAARAVAEAPPAAEGPQTRAFIERRIGEILVHLIRFDDALVAFERALVLDPEDPQIYLALANIYVRRNRLDEAVDAYSRAIDLSAGDPAAYHGLAEAELRRGRFDESIAMSEAALERDPEHIGAHYVRAMALVRSDRTAAGADALARYRRLEEAARERDHREREIGGLYKAAIAQSLEGNGEEAVRILREGIAAFPDARELYLNLGATLRTLGRYAESAGVFETMVEKGWGDAVVLRNLEAAARSDAGPGETSRAVR